VSDLKGFIELAEKPENILTTIVVIRCREIGALKNL